jgi:DNA polymerase-3 subunit alpha
MKLVSYSYLEGFYYEPRVDKALLKKYHKGIIALSSSLNGEVAQAIMNRGEDEAGKVIEEYRDIFGDDFYLEMVRHPNEHPHTKEVYEDQVFVNSVLKKFSETYRIPLVAANDVHFVDEKDAPAQDRLVCIKSGKYVDEDNRLHYTRQEWFKTQAEMRQLFADLPETLENTSKVADKVADYEIDKKAIMPEFPLPEGFDDHNEYLRHITYEGAKMRWDEITDEISERIDFELETIRNMGFPSYFLIVWDFLKAARELDVSVGPGRGSAAGSAVAYCLRITEIDPIKYDLLFERFLNPERVNMPDIDIDFDDDGRSRILNWVVNKYGEKRVAHIITFGSMAAKSAIRDVARVQRLPLPEADRLARMVPEKPGMTMEKALNSSPELKREMESGTDEVRSVLQYAATLEGSVRNIGTHACGIIIGRDDLENYIPITTAKDSELTYVTQYDGNFVEKVGLLKMDFLGLKTLSIIRDAIANVKLSKGIDVAIDNVPLDDKETFELYSRGETSGLFQFESQGMKKYLKELKPTRFEDLIAMNALYRPGPMEHIPSFIKRKHGEEKIEYDLPEMEEYLKETYGITVYQEQVMHLSRKLAGFSRGQSDSLRKAMGKKKKDLMAGLKVAFVNGCANNGIPKEKIEKIWHDWESFAQYAFNKSHATCYSYVSYQTAYLKAHYPAEYMAAVLSRNMNNIEKVTFFIEECRRMDINVLGPDINESYSRFTVNQKGEIRFGLTAVKGVGQAVVDAIVKERTENGPYQNIFDLVKRSDLKTVNRRSLEALALAGGFDGFKEAHRAQYFVPDEKGGIFLEKIIRYGQQYQQTVNSAQTSLFGDSGDTALPVIRFPETEKWGKLVQLRKERDVIGFYLSGHPLDAFQTEIEHICNATLNDLNKPLSDLVNQNFIVAGIVSKPSPPHLQTRTGKPFGKVTIEDYKGSFEFSVFGDDYARYKGFLETEGVPLLLKLKVVESNYNNGKDEKRHFINIQDIYFLGDALEKMVQKLIINLHLSELTNTMVEDLVTMVNTHPGKGSLQINIQAPEETLYLELYAKDKQVNLSAISKKLKRIEGLTYTLS